MAEDYIPNSDGDFDSFARQFRDQVNKNYSVLGLSAAERNNLNTEFSDWDVKYPAHIAAKDTAKSATQAKNVSRKTLSATIRFLMNKARASGATDDQIAEIGGRVHKKTRSATHAPDSRPAGEIDSSERLRHIIHFRDEFSASRRKPKGVFGCEIWLRIVAPGDAVSRNLDDYRKIATDTRSPYTFDFAPEDAEKSAHYILRWLSNRGEVGPISETIEATIGG